MSVLHIKAKKSLKKKPKTPSFPLRVIKAQSNHFPDK